MSLAVIVVGNICPATARAMMPVSDDGMLRDRAWMQAVIAPLIRNAKMEEELLAAAKRRDDDSLHDSASTRARVPANVAGNRETFKNTYAEARKRVDKCAKPAPQPGWTQGFRQDAWRQPLAETGFLRDCCRYIRYKKELVPREDQWHAGLDARGRAGHGLKALATIHTGLPQQHLLEHVQEMFRPQFDRLQVAELVRGAESTEAFLLRAALIRVISRALAGLSPITDDPALSERFWVKLDSDDVRIAVHGAWNM